MKPTIETAGEFKGWKSWETEPFEHQLVGPFYFKTDENGAVCAFRAQARHMNSGGVMHGGCLMTFADFALFGIAHQYLEDGYGVTASFNSEFLDGALVDEYIEARGEVLRAGRSLIFVRGLVTANERACLNFSGTIKRLKGLPKSLASETQK